MAEDRWMSCSTCRAPIAHGAMHYVCSVSTCNRDRTRLVFCSVACWDSHVAVLRHRDAWAVEAYAPASGSGRPIVPTIPEPTPEPAPAPAASAPARTVVSTPAPAPASTAGGPALSDADTSDILIVVSKLKKYIRERSGMNTSDAVAEGLSDHVRAIADACIKNAATAGRKTVLDRDVPPVLRRP
jgi:hypothetical protein